MEARRNRRDLSPRIPKIFYYFEIFFDLLDFRSFSKKSTKVNCTS